VFQVQAHGILTLCALLFGGNLLVPPFQAKCSSDILLCDIAHVSALSPLRDIAALLHHSLFLVITFYCSAIGFLKYHFAMLLLSEMSTPFVNYRWILVQSGHKNSSLYKWNGLILLLFFIVNRVFVYAYVLKDLYFNCWNEFEEKLSSKVIVYLLTGGFIYNVFWAQKLIEGALRETKTKSIKPVSPCERYISEENAYKRYP